MPATALTLERAEPGAASSMPGIPISGIVSLGTMLCAHCASPIPDGTRFCTNCGADAPDPAAATTGSLDDAGVAKLTRMLRHETAGEYEIEREIGRGGMGVVYLATEIQLRRRVAIKVLPPALTFGEGTIQRFRREARTAAALDHANIIPVHRVSSGGELMWYSMKLLEGKSLDLVLREQPDLDVDTIIAILEQVADALDYAHARGVIHRDIKPGNIVLDERGRVTVTDFGIAKEVQEGSTTTSGGLLGTPYYMSPEQYLGSGVSGAADQYSLAVLAYQCLARRLPFEAGSAYELLSKHVSETPPPLGDLRPGLAPNAYLAIEKALAKRPEDRFTTVTEFVHALAGRATVTPVRRRSGARRVRVLAATGMGAIAIVFVGTLVLRPDSTAEPVMPEPVPVRGPPPDAVTQPATRPPTSAAGPPAAPARVQAPMAVLIIRLSPGWARIYVDGELRGERPVHREELPPGTHTVRFERPGFLPIDTTLTLAAGENVIEIRLRPDPP